MALFAFSLSSSEDYNGVDVSVNISFTTDALHEVSIIRFSNYGDPNTYQTVFAPNTLVAGAYTYTDRTANLGTTYGYFIDLDNSIAAYDDIILSGFPTDDGVCYPCLISDPSSELLIQAATLQVYRPFSYAPKQSVNEIIGAKYPIVLSSYRGASTGTIEVMTHTFEQAQKMREILFSGKTLIFRVEDAVRFEAPSAAIAVGSVNEQQVITTDPTRAERKWTLEFVQIAIPSIEDITTNVLPNWQSVINCYATWGALLGDTVKAPSWLYVVYNPAIGDC
jgi:hypothetical protein